MGAVRTRSYAIGFVRGRALRSLTIGRRADVHATLRAIARAQGRSIYLRPLTEGVYLALASWPAYVWVAVIIVTVLCTW